MRKLNKILASIVKPFATYVYSQSEANDFENIFGKTWKILTNDVINEKS